MFIHGLVGEVEIQMSKGQREKYFTVMFIKHTQFKQQWNPIFIHNQLGNGNVDTQY